MPKLQQAFRFSNNLGSSIGWLSLVCLAIFLMGCGGGRPSRVKISGHVTVDGKPLKVGGISFKPAEGGRMAGGQLSEDGGYSTTMYTVDDGLPPGSYTVSVSAAQHINDYSQRWHAPQKYSDHKTSGLVAEITKETDALDFDLTWEGDDHDGPWVEEFKR